MSSVNITAYILFCFPVYTKDSLYNSNQTSVELFPNNPVAEKKT